MLCIILWQNCKFTCTPRILICLSSLSFTLQDNEGWGRDQSTENDRGLSPEVAMTRLHGLVEMEGGGGDPAEDGSRKWDGDGPHRSGGLKGLKDPASLGWTESADWAYATLPHSGGFGYSKEELASTETLVWWKWLSHCISKLPAYGVRYHCGQTFPTARETSSCSHDVVQWHTNRHWRSKTCLTTRIKWKIL